VCVLFSLVVFARFGFFFFFFFSIKHFAEFAKHM